MIAIQLIPGQLPELIQDGIQISISSANLWRRSPGSRLQFGLLAGVLGQPVRQIISTSKIQQGFGQRFQLRHGQGLDAGGGGGAQGAAAAVVWF